MTAFLNRRDFLISCLTGGAGLLLTQQAGLLNFSPPGASDRLRIAIIGLGNSGLRHLKQFLRLPDVEICALCDSHEPSLKKALALLTANGAQRPLLVKDYRRLMDIKSLDAVSIAVPEKDRARVAVDFCETKKGMLMERPFAATAAEGKKVVELTDKYGIIAQQEDNDISLARDNFFSPAAFHAIGEIHHFRGSKSLPAIAGARANVDDFAVRLSGSAWSELDMARCILQTETPSRVSSMCYAGSGNPFNKVLLDFEFPSNGRGRNIRFEISTSPAAGITGTSEFHGSSGKLSVTWRAAADNTAGIYSVSNFVQSVKENDPAKLLNPLDEALKSNLLVELAGQAIKNDGLLENDRHKPELVR